MFNYTAAGRRHLGVLVWIAAALRSNTSKIIAVIGKNLGELNLSNELKLASTYNHIWLTLAKRNTWKRMVGIMLAYAWLVVLKTLNQHRTTVGNYVGPMSKMTSRQRSRMSTFWDVPLLTCFINISICDLSDTGVSKQI